MELSEWREELAGAIDRWWEESDDPTAWVDGMVLASLDLADALLASPAMARLLAEVRAEALREFADKWAAWIATDDPQIRGGASYRARCEADRIARTNAHPTDDHAGEAK